MQTRRPNHHQRLGADGKEAMSRAPICEFTTDAAEVVYVDECDVVDERGVCATDEIALDSKRRRPSDNRLTCARSLRRNTMSDR